MPASRPGFEPDSVILRDPTGARALQILEQNYRNDPVSQELLLSLNEGKTIDFEVDRSRDNSQPPQIIRGKIIRSGYVPPNEGSARQPIIEVDGKLRFYLPAARSSRPGDAPFSSRRSRGSFKPSSPANWWTPKWRISPAD